MLSDDVRKLFKKWKLYEKAGKRYSIIYYEHPLVKVERIVDSSDRKEKRKLYDLIFNLYFDYEFTGQPISWRDIAKLLGVSHYKIEQDLNSIKKRLKLMYDYQVMN